MSKSDTKFPTNSLEALLEGKYFEKEKHYPEVFYSYPEDTLQTLIAFYEIWKFPEGAVPKKRQKDKYAMWINELRKIEDICGTNENVRIALNIAKERYDSFSPSYKFIIWKPLSGNMEKLLIHAMSIIKTDNEKRELEAKQRYEMEKARNIKVADKKVVKKGLSSLRESLQSEDE